MSRLVVNPGTPQAWEIQLKPGTNSFGRGEGNDFVINDPSVSGSHCQILINDGAAALKDLGSTNGTFVAGARVQERKLEDGGNIRLGGVPMIYYAAATAPLASPAVRPVVKVFVKAAVAPAAALATVVAAPAPPLLEAATGAEPIILTGRRFCRYHPKSPGRYVCQKCNKIYCDMCVQTQETGAGAALTCRGCGTAVAPVQFRAAPTKGFFAKLPGAFIYPFRDAGVLILVCAALGFGALGFVSNSLFGLVFTVALLGFLFLFMQNIITTTTADEGDPLGFPEISGLVSAAFQLVCTVAASFWLTIALLIAKLSGVNVPLAGIIASVILAGVYFPMALLAVAMKDSALAANPLVVIPAMLKAPLNYSVTVALMLGVFGVRQIGDMLSSGAGTVALRTMDKNTFFAAAGFKLLWPLLSVYLLTVTMRILGLFYNSSKQKLGWFNF